MQILPARSEDDPRRRQAAFNAASCDQWAAFAGHRARVSALLGAGSAPRPSRLCILGAGNGNDLDLPALLEAHHKVHLVDLDPAALGQGVERQGVAGHPGLRLHGGFDVTGRLDAVASWTPLSEIGPPDLEALAGWPADRVARALPGPFDLVASTCLLSQLADTLARALGDEHPRSREAVRALRTGHLRLLDRLAAPGGTAVLITDVVSSATLPTLGSVPDTGLLDLLPRLSRDGNFIRGVNPAALRSAFRSDPVLAPRAAGLEALPPWRWRLHDRLYLVWALRWRAGDGRSRPANGVGKDPGVFV